MMKALVKYSPGQYNMEIQEVPEPSPGTGQVKVAVHAVGQFVRAEFSEYIQGSNTGDTGVERYVSDGIATFADCLRVQGVRQAEVYYEETFSSAIMQPTYNVFVRLEMSKVDYLKAKADVLKKLPREFHRR